MAEQLNKNNYIKHPDKIGAYNYYSLGETTIKQLQENNLISSRTKKYQAKKPDALVTDDNKNVIVYIENKDIGELDTEDQLKDAFNQEIEVAQAVNAKIYLITDTLKSYWYNPLTKNEIKNENDEYLRILFKHNENKKELEKLIKKVVLSISKDNDAVCKTEYLDPTDLARNVQQKIWIRNSASPETCLYTFVELFIFKYLSDLKVLTGNHSFKFLCDMYDDEGNTNEEILAYYLSPTGPREKIKTLFPEGVDKTTIVNGDVFHADKDENGEYIINGDGDTFKSIIEEFKKYETEHGKFLNINKDFKSKLFESFLKNEKDKKKMGQFFTPLKVVQQMNRMIEVKSGDKICDPACGVGKFLLEAISGNLDNYYKYNNGKIESNIEIYGFDKYSEDNSDRTIILAKANMLIYLSKLITDNPTPKLTKEISKILNNSFSLKRSNLGTLEAIEENKYDYIMTNPPYVVNGSGDIKNSAVGTGNYNWNGLGIEALFIEWIIKSLKEGGTALIVVPDGILSNDTNKNLRKQVLNECDIQCIISLPVNTFFGTPKKTYILNIKKKYKDSLGKTKKQQTPVFTYICSSIGETLNTYRFDIDDNDLESAINQYNIYKTFDNKSKFKAVLYDENDQPYIDKKCKCIEIDDFYQTTDKSWIIDNYWSDEEKIELGFLNKRSIMTPKEFSSYVEQIIIDITEYSTELPTQDSDVKYTQELLSNIFTCKKGNCKYTKKYCNDNSGEYEVYTGSTLKKFADLKTYDYDVPNLTYTTDGEYAGTLKVLTGKYNVGGHRAILLPKACNIYLEYFEFILQEDFYKSVKDGDVPSVSWEKSLSKLVVNVPITDSGDFDINMQKEIANKYKKFKDIKALIVNQLSKLRYADIRL